MIIDNVTVRWSGAGAEAVDDAVIQVLQPALLSVEGVTTTSSISSEGSARVRLEFEPGWDMAKAAEDVQLAVDATSNLPEDAEDPEIRRGQWSDRVTDVVITGPVAPEQLGRLNILYENALLGLTLVVALLFMFLNARTAFWIAAGIPRPCVVQWRFFNAPEQGSVTGNFAMLPGATREDTLEMMQSLQDVAETLGTEDQTCAIWRSLCR